MNSLWNKCRPRNRESNRRVGKKIMIEIKIILIWKN